MNKNQLLIKLSNSGRFWQVEYESLSEPEKVFRAIWELESQVNNGGFDQYFFNSSGDLASTVQKALTVIGAHQTARIVASALSVFADGGPPSDQTERRELLLALDESQQMYLDELDREFYAYPDNITDLLFKYVQANQGEISGAIHIDI